MKHFVLPIKHLAVLTILLGVVVRMRIPYLPILLLGYILFAAGYHISMYFKKDKNKVINDDD